MFRNYIVSFRLLENNFCFSVVDIFKKEIENKIVVMVSFAELDSYVTWPSLETALNGLKEHFNKSASNLHSTSTVSVTAQSYTQTVSLLVFYLNLTNNIETHNHIHTSHHYHRRTLHEKTAAITRA